MKKYKATLGYYKLFYKSNSVKSYENNKSKSIYLMVP